MKLYQVEIMETLVRIIEVEAESKEDAITNVMEEYNNAELVLDADDFLDVEFNVINGE